ncbi:hypothetical protein ATO12_14395 [Aquimarina atlantica]|uniref:Uncharacterized protein n=1 Tax=Aquimarina atlantica TaxID=1317122 RepID=A0A023BVP5_9FLAO|nr:hypothetical protein [Aquimarina atlantica]EZH74061.1 hypothetical protein ATO12_14395 [Aquimarina atlantica]
MRILIVLGIITISIIIILIVLLKKRKPISNCILYKNYVLIRDSPYSDTLSDYEIIKEKDNLRFRTKEGYSLFIIKVNSEENQEVKLIGLASYGARNVEFNRYICNLVNQINNTTNIN